MASLDLSGATGLIDLGRTGEGVENWRVHRPLDLDRFYGLLDGLRARCGGERMLAACDGRTGWPPRGVYFFFEAGEYRADGVTPRVVRVGTHGLRPSKSTLWDRLSQHRGTAAGARAGGGNHRGSIFRRHVGSALLATGDWPQEIRDSWGVGQSAPPGVCRVEHPLECAVSAYIGAMPFLWLEVDDAPSTSSEQRAL